MSMDHEYTRRKEKAIERLMNELAKGEQSGQTDGWIDIETVERDLGIVNMKHSHWTRRPKVDSLSVPNIQTLDSMSEEQFDAMMQKGYNEAKSGIGLSVNEALKRSERAFENAISSRRYGGAFSF